MDYFLIHKIFDEKIKKRKRKIRKEKKKKRSKKRKREKKRLTIYSYILRIYSHILNQKEKEKNPNPKFFIDFLFYICQVLCTVHGYFFNHTDICRCIILFKMAITFKLPVINADSALLLNTPVAATDVVLATGLLSIKDESGATALKIKATDLLGFRYTAGTTGTANVVDVQLSGVSLVANGLYSLTVSAPYAQAFFSGGVETNATFQPRTYSFGVDATPTAGELATGFAAEINADVNAYFTASVVSTTTVRITAKNAGFGALNITGPVGATESISTAWVSPAGTPSQVLAQINNAGLVSAALYQTYQIIYRKRIRTNLVNGMEVSKPVTALVYINAADAGAAATVTKLTSILNGSWAATATQYVDYLGCPAV